VLFDIVVFAVFVIALFLLVIRRRGIRRRTGDPAGGRTGRSSPRTIARTDARVLCG